MKHSVGIIAHRAEPQLKWLVEDLVQQNMEVHIHADIKAIHNIRKILGEHANCILPDALDVKRAHISLVKATLALMQAARKGNADYFHLISGQDALVKEPAEIDRIVSTFPAKSFMDFRPIPVSGNEKQTDTFLDYSIRADRIPVQNYSSFAFDKGRALHEVRHFPADKWVQNIHRHLGGIRSYWRLYNRLFRRTDIQKKVYLGSAWFSLHRKHLELLLDAEEKTFLLSYFEHALFPDEMYFQTLAERAGILSECIPSDLRYIDWSKPVNYGPTVLRLEDMDRIKMSNGIFARKWELQNESEYQKIKEIRHVR